MKRFVLSVGLVFLLFAAVAAVRAETDPRIGTWKLDVAKSKSSNGLPMSETRTYSAEGSAIMSTNEGVNAQGKPISTHYEATADGKERPTGAPGMTLSIKQTGPGAYAGTVKKDGKVVSTNVAVISGGGKVFTFKNKGTDADGKAFTSTVVYEKQ
jgi:hypothetical protein